MNSANINVLVIEDEAVDAALLIEELELFGFRCHWQKTDSYETLQSALSENWDVVLCDFVVPGMQYQKSLELVRAKNLDIPFIIVSGKRGEVFVVETMRAGCADFIHKDRLIRLGPSVLKEVARAKEIQQSRKNHNKLTMEIDRSRRLKSIGLSASELAHNLNNLLTVMMGNLDFALLTSKEVSTKKHLEIVLEAADSASRITRNLLQLATGPELEPVKVNLKLMLEKIVALVHDHLPSNIELLLTCEADMQEVNLDLPSIEQALLNIILNARDSFDDGGQISISAAIIDDYWSIKIADSGCGIPDDMQEQVFEPFYTSKGQKGNGLGLSHAFQTLQSHHGHLNVESELGTGSTFELTAPLHSLHATKQPTTPAAKKQGSILLIVSDETELLMTKSFLNDFGYDVIAVQAVSEAKELLKNQVVVNLVISDLITRDGGAAELSNWIKKNSFANPLLVLSESIVDGKSESHSVLVKPIRKSELIEAVLLAISEAQSDGVPS